MHVRPETVIEPDTPPDRGWPRGMRRLRAACATSVALLLLVVLGGCTGDRVDFALAAPVPAPVPRIEAAQALRMGENLLTGGDPTGAAVFFRRAHALAPDDPVPILGLADADADADAAAAAATGRHDAAAELFRQALARDPGNPAARLGCGRTLLAMGRLGPARAELRAALDADPADPGAALALGVAAELDGDPDAARAVYREALRHNPDHVQLRNNFAVSLAIAGDSEQAIALLDDLARNLEGGARVRQNLALANALAGHDD